jgi:hypothetical protein
MRFQEAGILPLVRQMAPSAGKGINKVRHIHTMEYYSAIKWNKILIHST